MTLKEAKERKKLIAETAMTDWEAAAELEQRFWFEAMTQVSKCLVKGELRKLHLEEAIRVCRIAMSTNKMKFRRLW